MTTNTKVKIFIWVGLIASIALNVLALRGDFGPDMQAGTRLVWNIR